MGLCLPHEFQKLVWAMKRHKGEEILRRTEKNTAAMCSAMMFDNMMKYGMSPVQPPVPGTIGGSGNTAPTMSVSTASTPSYDTTDDHPCHWLFDRTKFWLDVVKGERRLGFGFRVISTFLFNSKSNACDRA